MMPSSTESSVLTREAKVTIQHSPGSGFSRALQGQEILTLWGIFMENNNDLVIAHKSIVQPPSQVVDQMDSASTKKSFMLEDWVPQLRQGVQCTNLISGTDKAERLSVETTSYGSQLVVFPEEFFGGYPCGSNFGFTIVNWTGKGKENFEKHLFFLLCFFFEQ